MDDLISIAERFINTTNSHIFLTGKAGTGKTTFLKSLAHRTHKSFIVVAPTGIAALNAGGVTIHSQFLLPPMNFIPERGQPTNDNQFINQDILARQHPLNSARKKVLRAIDLLVIDEVSMLRADLLDAIDYRMKAARGNYRNSFGGVQVLFIGDLFQLPPVVKNESWNTLSKYYNSPWFFEAHGLKHEKLVYIELQKIFRQKDETFIGILNNLRNNTLTETDVSSLNQQFATAEVIKDIREVITLTTHNYKADELNQRALAQLPGPSFFFDAIIKDDFPESMYPVSTRIELRVGAQVMFIRNDTDAESKEYYNGKLATVRIIEDEEIQVSMEGRDEFYTLKREVWENKRYTVNEKKDFDLESEVLGSFEQFPVKLAWAITVHKSQGLTFDKAIVDVGQAFADGQVYVALSRLRSLQGLVLRTRIVTSVISTDNQVIAFANANHRPDQLGETMKERQQVFISHLMDRTFDFSDITKEIRHVEKGRDEDVLDKSMSTDLGQIASALEGEQNNCGRFKVQLEGVLQQGDHAALFERLRKGRDYYKNLIATNLKVLLHHQELTRKRKRVKSYLTRLSDIDQLMDKKLEEIDKVVMLTRSILTGTDDVEFDSLTKSRSDDRAVWLTEIRTLVGSEVEKETPKKKKKGSKGKKKSDGPSTYELTLGLLKTGLTVDQIAAERGLTRGTIESHLAREVEAGSISIFTFIAEDQVTVISSAVAGMQEGFTSKDLFVKLEGKFGYGAIHAVMAHLRVEK